MVKIIGSAALALVTTLPALASAQVFRTCQDAYNYGHNVASLSVGQAFAQMRCAPSGLGGTESTLVRSLQRINPRFINTDAMKLCFYDGVQNGAIDRLQDEYARCSSTPGFPELTFQPMARLSIAVMSSMTRSLRRPPGAEGLSQVFNRDYGSPDYDDCVSMLESAEREIMTTSSARPDARTLNWLEGEICR
ncbi:hypothetical protein [Polyangium aurulentum]|uniref:hypothetical protein n=1 Tax=Polyangium aurulentum TaxID=2567896 RepID=UPI0010ADDDC0|nr:hypothetical protein [Polyangium aurulentum]UQA59536.1 hypothetical protein E8A73_003210 [Polyangium aurulentum]